MKKRKFCIVTGSRAEYGLLKPLIALLQDDKDIDLKIIATGMHLHKKSGLTFKEIEKDGFKINEKLATISDSDSYISVNNSISNGVIGFSKIFSQLSPDVVIVLGDRFEIFASTIAAYFLKIPVAHINGGETTEGAFDEGIRHSITKMSYLHFVSTLVYKKRVMQLGENPKNVFNVGGLFIDAIKNSKLLSKNQLQKLTGIHFHNKNLIVTYHPVTLNNQSSEESFGALLNVLDNKKDINIIFTSPNADPGNSVIHKMIQDFVKKNKERAISFKSLGHLNYISCLQFVDGMIGNSSSGITEAPIFKIGTVNIGDRQEGRIKSNSIIDCDSTEDAIDSAIDYLYSKKFQSNLNNINNPYGDGTTAHQILNILKNFSFPTIPKKKFFDIKFDIKI